MADAWKGAQDAAGVWALPGLVHPEAISWSTSGFFVTGVFSSPFACQFASGSGTSGVVAGAHGTTNGVDTQTYSVNLSGLVPGAGSQLVYITASYAQVQQTPTSIVGPPAGNPAFNPNFIAFNAYTEMVDSLSVQAQTGVPNGLTTLELARTTLSAGQTGISLTGLVFSHQQPAARIPTIQTQSLSGSNTLSTSQVGLLFSLTTDGSTTTLPAAASWPGRSFRFFGAPSGGTYMSIQSNGTDNIWSVGGAEQSTTSLTLRQGAFLELFSNGTSIIALESNGIFPLTFPLTGAPPSNMTYDSNGNLTLPQSLSVTDPNNAGVTIVGSGSDGANLRLSCGGSTPYKFIRNLGGNLEFINSAYSAVIANLDDSGNFNAGGRLTATSGAFGTGNNQIATLLGDFSISDISATNGYQVLPNGLLIQWGITTITSWTGISGGNVEFPFTFPHTCLQVVLCEGGGGSWNTGNATMYCPNSVGQSSFSVLGLYWNGSEWVGPPNSTFGFRWIAIGY